MPPLFSFRFVFHMHQRYKLVCYLCNSTPPKSGACVQCIQPNCYKAFHSLCAQMGNCYSDWVETGPGGHVVRRTYCKVHHPHGVEWDESRKRWVKVSVTKGLPLELQMLLRLRGHMERARLVRDTRVCRVLCLFAPGGVLCFHFCCSCVFHFFSLLAVV